MKQQEMARWRGKAAQRVERRDAGAGKQFAAQQPAVVDRQRYLPGAGHERPAAFRATLPAGGKGDHQAAVEPFIDVARAADRARVDRNEPPRLTATDPLRTRIPDPGRPPRSYSGRAAGAFTLHSGRGAA